MNPETNKFEKLKQSKEAIELEHKFATMVKQDGMRLHNKELLRPDGTPVPKHWSIFKVDENYIINNYTFKCKYIGETSILFEPVGPIIIGGQNDLEL